MFQRVDHESGYLYEIRQTCTYSYATNPVTVSIETDYLLDAVPWEFEQLPTQKKRRPLVSLTFHSAAPVPASTAGTPGCK
jgi:hypothetical protein